MAAAGGGGGPGGGRVVAPSGGGGFGGAGAVAVEVVGARGLPGVGAGAAGGRGGGGVGGTVEVRLGRQRACTGAVLLAEEPAAPEWREALLFDPLGLEEGPLVIDLALFACRLQRQQEGYEPPAEEAPQARPLMLLSRGRLELDVAGLGGTRGACGRGQAPIRWVPLRPPGHAEGWLPRLGALAVRVYWTHRTGPALPLLGLPCDVAGGGDLGGNSEPVSTPPHTLEPAAPAKEPAAPRAAASREAQDAQDGATEEAGGAGAPPRAGVVGREPPEAPPAAPMAESRPTASAEGAASFSPCHRQSFEGTGSAWAELSSGLGRWQGELRKQARSRSPGLRESSGAKNMLRHRPGPARAAHSSREQSSAGAPEGEPARLHLWKGCAHRLAGLMMLSLACAVPVVLLAFFRIGGHGSFGGPGGPGSFLPSVKPQEL